MSSAKSWLQLRAWRFGWRWPRAYALLLELGRIVPRIRFSLTTLRVDRDRELSAGPACSLEQAGCHPRCSRTHARIRGIREQEKVTPWIGRYEVYLFFRGWNAAERFLADSSCTGIDIQSRESSAMPEASPQSSRCDPSDHHRRHPQRLMNAAGIVPKHEQAHGGFQVTQLFREPVGKASEAPQVHSDIQVLPLVVARSHDRATAPDRRSPLWCHLLYVSTVRSNSV